MGSAVPPQSFALDRSIWNDTLYTQIRDFWFAGLPAGAKRGNEPTYKRWWGMGRSDEEGKAFDEECRQNFGPALDSIGPEKLALPPWKSYADDLAHSQEIAAPFLAEVEHAQREHSKKAADTFLSLVLLLDQMPRNIHRSNEGLRLVYRHYDRLAWSLMRGGTSSLDPDPLAHPSFRGAPAYITWFSLPLMHAEDLHSQQLAYGMMEKCMAEAQEDGDADTVKDTQRSLGFAKSHLDIVEKFGRFPHRNECLEREHQGEEKEWLKTGETFGVKQSQKTSQAKDEL